MEGCSGFGSHHDAFIRGRKPARCCAQPHVCSGAICKRQVVADRLWAALQAKPCVLLCVVLPGALHSPKHEQKPDSSFR